MASVFIEFLFVREIKWFAKNFYAILFPSQQLVITEKVCLQLPFFKNKNLRENSFRFLFWGGDKKACRLHLLETCASFFILLSDTAAIHSGSLISVA